MPCIVKRLIFRPTGLLPFQLCHVKILSLDYQMTSKYDYSLHNFLSLPCIFKRLIFGPTGLLPFQLCHVKIVSFNYEMTSKSENR